MLSLTYITLVTNYYAEKSLLGTINLIVTTENIVVDQYW